LGEFVGGYIYEIRLHGFVTTVETINVFHYWGTTILPNIDDLANDLKTNVWNNFTGICGGSTVFDNALTEGLRGDSRFSSTPLSIAGGVSGDQCPPFVTWDFTYLRGAVGERNGYKRLSGVPESFQSNGVASGGGLAGCNAVAALLGSTRVIGGEDYFPAIQRKHIGHVTQVPPRYFGSSGVQYSKIGSQNSRKFGHGR
jgi:hypothetical protein